jgi:hypothetical protein
MYKINLKKFVNPFLKHPSLRIAAINCHLACGRVESLSQKVAENIILYLMPQ